MTTVYKFIMCALHWTQIRINQNPDKENESELPVYTLTVHDAGVNQGLCAESILYICNNIDDLRVK